MKQLIYCYNCLEEKDKTYVPLVDLYVLFSLDFKDYDSNHFLRLCHECYLSFVETFNNCTPPDFSDAIKLYDIIKSNWRKYNE